MKPERDLETLSRKFFTEGFSFFLRKNWITILLIVLTIFSLSIQISLSMRTWGHVHANEIFRSLEVAHQMVYGYGNIPPEYYQTNPQYPSFASCRSHLFPILFTIPLYIGEAMNWDYWKVTLPLIRILLGINGGLITPSTYFLVKKYSKEKNFYAIASSIFVTLSPIIWLNSFRSLTNIFFVPWLFFLITLYWHMIEKINNRKSVDNNRKRKFLHFSENIKYYSIIAIISTIVGLILYIRLDFIIGIAAILILKFPYKNVKIYVTHILGFIIAAVIGGIIDLIYYGDFFISPINWLKFNLIEGNSAIIFGEDPFFYYFILPARQPFVLISLIITSLVVLTLVYLSVAKIKRNQKTDWRKIRILGGFLLAGLFVLIIFSIQKHKEARFIYMGVIYLHIGLAISLVILFRFLITKMSISIADYLVKIKPSLVYAETKKAVSITFITILGTSFLTGIIVLNSFQLQTDYYWSNNGIAKGLVFIGNQDDAKGVILFDTLFNAKMYSYLHKDIPMKVYPLPIDVNVIPDLVPLLNKTGITHNYALLPTILFEEMPFFEDFLMQSNFVYSFEIRNQARIYLYSL